MPTLDIILKEISRHLETKLPWLDVAFGKAERLVKEEKGRLQYFPAIYKGNKDYAKNDYLGLFPDSKIGNFSFFWFPDPREIDWSSRAQSIIKTPISIIFWFDLRKVFETEIDRNKEGLRDRILGVLGKELFLSQGHLEINRCYDLSENIYREFTISEIDNQFLMHPYSGFRFDGILTFTQPCI